MVDGWNYQLRQNKNERDEDVVAVTLEDLTGDSFIRELALDFLTPIIGQKFEEVREVLYWALSHEIEEDVQVTRCFNVEEHQVVDHLEQLEQN